VTKSDAVWDLEPDHRPEAPRLRRVSAPVDQHPVYWDYVSQSIVGDVVADLVGPDVKFHHSKLNFKWAKGGEVVKWHYDISFWPHTNYSPLTVGTYIYDTTMEMGPVGIIPKSHLGDTMYTQYDETGKVGGLPVTGGRGEDRSQEGGLPHRAGRLAHAPQLPHHPRLAEEHLRPRASAAASTH
jgi:hypothetical protein